MDLRHALRLDFVTGQTRQLVAEAKELSEAFRELREWHDRAFIAGALKTDWLGGGQFQIHF
jgi:hypothetical protein